ncbi:tyrosine-type recombinase/integrase [Nonomuraea sp. KM88]|uniref:tyrosine-type recombinase/integrase n=1 Tax=Nonomuraea sp. KM88 TaxID=3457427 RepID=UPI003FCC3EC6
MAGPSTYRRDACPDLSPRGRCIALIPYYAGARISEVVRLNVDDIQKSARKGRLRLYGKGDKFREVDIHPKLRTELQLWLDERPNWPHTDDNRALFLNAKGGRLSARAAGGIIAEIAQTAGLDDPTTAHVLRHTLTTTLVRGKTDLVLVAEILCGRSRNYVSAGTSATPAWKPPARAALRQGQGRRPETDHGGPLTVRLPVETGVKIDTWPDFPVSRLDPDIRGDANRCPALSPTCDACAHEQNPLPDRARAAPYLGGADH